jgi:hypothetical protein
MTGKTLVMLAAAVLVVSAGLASAGAATFWPRHDDDYSGVSVCDDPTSSAWNWNTSGRRFFPRPQCDHPAAGDW